MSRFSVKSTAIPDLHTVRRSPIEDHRGRFERLFCASDLEEAGWTKPLRQINLARTVRRGGVRGLHYQLPPAAERKLVSCIAGEVWDVALDLRRGSPTFLSWHAELLSPENGVALMIPEGFAHGFQVLSDGATLLYCHSEDWTPELERGVHPVDPAVGIAWPLPVADLSARDASRDLLTRDFVGVEL